MPTKLSKNQKFAIGGTFGLLASALILFLIIRASKDEPQDDKTGKSNKSEEKGPDVELLISEQKKLVESLFAGDEAAQKWIKEGGSKVIDSPEFDAFFKANYSAGKKEELGKVLKATSEMMMAQAKKYETEKKYLKTEETLVNAAISKSLSTNLEESSLSGEELSTSLSVDQLFVFSDVFKEIMFKMKRNRTKNVQPFFWDYRVQADGEEEVSVAESYVKEIREACLEVIKKRADHELFLKLVESLKVADGFLQFKSEIKEPLLIA